MNMGFSRTKEDDVQRISTLVFITNFPDNVGAKDLWNACKQYGYVVDAFIPNKKSKAGKKFGFVRFINVFDVDRLVNNLCTVWIGSHRIHANIAKFHRQKGVNSNSASSQGNVPRDSSNGVKRDSEYRNNSKSYAYVAKGGTNEIEETESKPVLVLDDSCVNSQDFSCCLNGKIKEFDALANLKVVLENEGFNDISLKYLGGMWVMIVFKTLEVKNKFSSCAGVKSWFSQLIQASNDFLIDGRVTWVNIEGVPLKVWNDNTFKRIAAKWGSLLTMENSEEDNLHSKRLCVYTKGVHAICESFKILFQGKVYWLRAREIPGWNPDFEVKSDDSSDLDEDRSVGEFKDDFDGSGDSDEERHEGEVKEMQGENEVSMVPETDEQVPILTSGAVIGSSDNNGAQSEDPFNIYSLLNKNKVDDQKVSNSKESLKYPPGFTPCDTVEDHDLSSNQRAKKVGMESAGSGHVRKNEILRTGGSLLTVMEELIKVGQTMGFNMEGCTKNIEEIIESQGVDGVFR
ncbi:nucleotide-binding alpha-beta plait domain-containing protein [Tanacetum coccineum]